MPIVTAVIMSYNRQDALRRQLLYYGNKPFHLIFADGSDDDWGLGWSGSIGEMTWEYFRISGWSFMDRYRKAVSKIETEFMFFIDDEECILPSGIEHAVRFLEANPDHSCAGGRVEIAKWVNKRIWIDRWKYFSSDFSLLDEDPIARVSKLIKTNRTTNLAYQVNRATIVKNFAQLPFDFEFERTYWGTFEILFAVYLTTLGKWIRGNFPFWLRYGGSIRPPSTIPKFMSVDKATEIVEWLNQAFIDDFSGESVIREKSLISKDLHETLLGSYGEFAFLPKRIRNKKKIDRDFKWLISAVRNQVNYFTKKFMLTYLPKVFEKMFPNEAMRVKSYATRYSNGSSEVLADLAKFEDLWSRYPHGLSNDQFQQELARV